MTVKIMWAIKHLPSGSWDNGDTELTLYPSAHEARLACVHPCFVPVRVEIKEKPV